MTRSVTADFTITFGTFPADEMFGLVEGLADAFDNEADAEGPMVVGNKAEGTIALTFAFPGTGAVEVDVARALNIIGRALLRQEANSATGGSRVPAYDLPHMVVEQRMAFA